MRKETINNVYYILKFYRPDKAGNLGEEIITVPYVQKITKQGKYKIIFDVSSSRIPFNEKGVYIAANWVLSDINSKNTLETNHGVGFEIFKGNNGDRYYALAFDAKKGKVYHMVDLSKDYGFIFPPAFEIGYFPANNVK